MLKKVSLVTIILFYLAAGVNHFRSPGGYLAIIPHYLPWHNVLNYVAGGFEILFAILLCVRKTRKFAAWGIILMLIAFLPVHISMISNAPLKLGTLIVTPLLAWLRLLLFQPLLIIWAWLQTKPSIEKY